MPRGMPMARGSSTPLQRRRAAPAERPAPGHRPPAGGTLTRRICSNTAPFAGGSTDLLLARRPRPAAAGRAAFPRARPVAVQCSNSSAVWPARQPGPSRPHGRFPLQADNGFYAGVADRAWSAEDRVVLRTTRTRASGCLPVHRPRAATVSIADLSRMCQLLVTGTTRATSVAAVPGDGQIDSSRWPLSACFSSRCPMGPRRRTGQPIPG